MMARTALVTGVVGGIGAAIAARLAADGTRVIVSDLPGEALDARGRELDLPAIAADLGDPASVKEMNAQIVADHGAPDILVNAAGGNMKGATIMPSQSFFDLSVSDFQKVTVH